MVAYWGRRTVVLSYYRTVAVWVLGLIACIVYHMCMCVFVHVGHAKVIVSARSPLYMIGGYVTKAYYRTVAVWVLGLIACIVYHMCMCVFVHVGHAKVIVSARSPLYMIGGYVTKAWDEGYYIRC